MANPNANAIPRTLMAVDPVPIPAMTTAPHPKKTSVNVPMNSAVGFFMGLPQVENLIFGNLTAARLAPHLRDLDLAPLASQHTGADACGLVMTIRAAIPASSMAR
jgi:hypothetical protein